MKNSEAQLFEQLKKSVTQNKQLLFPGKILFRAAQLCPDAIALIYKDEKITFKQLFHQACAFTHFLKECGVKPDDRILICFDNSPEFYSAYFGAWQCGAIVAPINTFLKEKELAHIIADAQPKCIITSIDRVELFKINSDEVPIYTPEDVPNATQTYALKENEIVSLDQHKLAALLYTSGTTGLPKGVMLSGKNIMTNVLQAMTRLKLTQKHRVLGVLPLFHVFAQNACIWAAFYACCTIVLVPKIDRRYILAGLKHKPTVFLGVPALFGLLCLMKNAPLNSIQFFASGGDAMPDKIRMAFSLLYRRKIASGYGMTEASPYISFDLDDELQVTNAAGEPLIGVTCEIRDEHNNVLSHGEIGRLWMKGDNVMLGYYRAPEKTKEVIVDGWLDTGDLAYINHQGKIVITGRLKDLIINKGFNIYPQEIENVLLSHANVVRVGVVGKADNEQGEIPVAYIQIIKEQSTIEKELIALCKQHLARYKIPREFHISVKELPLTATAKVDKKVLRAWLKGEK